MPGGYGFAQLSVSRCSGMRVSCENSVVMLFGSRRSDRMMNMAAWLILLAIAFCVWLNFVRHGRSRQWIESLTESGRPGIRYMSHFLVLVFFTSEMFFIIGPHWMDSPFVSFIILCLCGSYALGESDAQGKEQGVARHGAAAALWSVPTKYVGALAATLVVFCLILILLFLSDREEKWLRENPVFWATSLTSVSCLLFLCVTAGILLSTCRRRLYSGVMSSLLLLPLVTLVSLACPWRQASGEGP